MRIQLRQYFIWTAGCLFLLSASALAADKDDEALKKDYELMQFFVRTLDQIDRNYVKDIDRRELVEAAIRGMLGKLDQYSSYISPDDLARFNLDVEKQFGGIGIQVHIDPKTKRLTVMTPLPGTPAYRAGIRAGDTIMEIKGKSTEGFKLSQAVKLLKGRAGEAVTIGIRHAGSNDIEQVKIVRAVIQVATALGDRYGDDGAWDFMLDDEKKIGYIRLTHFSRRSSQELRAALSTLKSQGMKALILDLRNNPGGLLSQATEISDLFIESGRIVSTKGRNSRERVWTAKKSGTFSGFPMAVIVNRFSASASEILSACLQDHKRAVIVGERTWGKGSVQNVIELEGGGSALKLTTASYHRPSGKNIHRFRNSKESDEWGVMPDEGSRLRLPTGELQKQFDYRRDRDVLSEEGPPKSSYTDRQLQKAIERVLAKLGTAKPDEKPKDAKTNAVKAKKPKATGAAAIEKPKQPKLPRTLAA